MGKSDFKTKLRRKAFDKAIEGSFWIFQQDAIDGTGIGLCAQTVVKNVVGSAKLTTSDQVRQGPGYGRSRSLLGSYCREQGQGRQPPHYQSYSAPRQARNQTRNNHTPKHKQNLNDAVEFHEPVGHSSANITTMKFTLTKSDLGSITEAAVVGTVKDDSLAGKINTLFSRGSFSTWEIDSSTASVSEETKVEHKPKKPVEEGELIAVMLILELMTANLLFLDKKMAGQEAEIEEAIGAGILDVSGSYANAKAVRAKRDTIEAMKPPSRTAPRNPKLDLNSL
ncbi:hypothetical protein RSOLAG22IIIB_06701 [Rhizoctonia solani]|uniref:Uncharacterized protein n=1 Tax=Rhizoctonia solani TaxID=456999 RepID=A0A0K6GGA2_9AGAM|nr:hypothetical protein RSOLAG22IIIB_06701 [Rhizoctonia solani]